MKILVGETNTYWREEIVRRGWGRMWIARDWGIFTYPNEPWGLDNGAFRDWKRGDAFDERLWGRALERAVEVGFPPYIAIIPDKPSEGLDSLRFSEEWLSRLDEYAYPWFLAVQDGMTPGDVVASGMMDRVAGLFLGGTNAFKGTAKIWSDLAHQHELLFHYGRAGTMSKIAHAFHVGADSLDSALPMWTRERWFAFADAIAHGPEQRDLFWEAQ